MAGYAKSAKASHGWVDPASAGEPLVQINVRIPASVAKGMKVLATAEGELLQCAAERAFRIYLAEHHEAWSKEAERE